MKILFICWANVGRSQMAAAYYNHLTGTKDADSAGTEVELPGETLLERRQRRGGTNVIDAMQADGIDVRSSRKTQLLEDMLDRYDRVISMADDQYTPEWLSKHLTFERWHIKDPGGKGIEATSAARDAIKLKVRRLIEELSPDLR